MGCTSSTVAPEEEATAFVDPAILDSPADEAVDVTATAVLRLSLPRRRPSPHAHTAVTASPASPAPTTAAHAGRDFEGLHGASVSA